MSDVNKMVWMNLSGVVKREEVTVPYHEFKKKIEERYPDYKIIFMPPTVDWETCYILYDYDEKLETQLENVSVNK